MTGLIFLVILTLLGLTAMQSGILEERMSGNARDRNLAFQAAEAALRDAERDIQCISVSGGQCTRTKKISGMSHADTNCTDGLCCELTARACTEPSTPVYKSKSLKASPSVKYGTYTAAPDIDGVSEQPRYLIEPFKRDEAFYYRITVRGYGANTHTQVTLQEVYKE